MQKVRPLNLEPRFKSRVTGFQIPSSGQPTTLPGSGGAASTVHGQGLTLNFKLEGGRWEGLEEVGINCQGQNARRARIHPHDQGREMFPMSQTHSQCLCPERSTCSYLSTHEEPFSIVSSTFRTRRERCLAPCHIEKKTRASFYLQTHTPMYKLLQGLSSPC